MHKQRYIDKSAKWFSQWSRKAYAMFLSISKVVHIGRLSADISQQALLKSTGVGVITLSNALGDSSIDDLVKGASDDGFEILPSIGLLTFLEQIITTKQTVVAPARVGYHNSSAQSNIEFKIFSKAESLSNIRVSAFFYCVNLKIK